MSTTSPIADAIIQKKVDCIEKGFRLDVVFINPADLISIISDARFQDFTYYSKTTNPIPANEVGTFLGIKVIVSTNIPIHKLLFTVNMAGYNSLQGSALENTEKQVNPSRRYS